MTRVLGFFAGGQALAPAFAAPGAASPRLVSDHSVPSQSGLTLAAFEAALAGGAPGLAVYAAPADALARLLDAGGAPGPALQDWTAEARRLLSLCETYEVALVCAGAARAAPGKTRALIRDRFGFDTDETGLAALAAEGPDPLSKLVAEAFLAAAPEAAGLGAALAARACPMPGDCGEGADPAAALEALRRLKNTPAREAGTADSQAGEAQTGEAELLRAHLHLVQSQAETWFRRAREAGPGRAGDGARLDALKGELAAARAEADSYRSSLSWRLAAPLRALSARAPAGLTRAGARLRRQAVLVKQSGFFDAAWYRERYPDIAEAGLDALDHYLRFGWREGRRPGPDFDGPGYLRMNPDVAALGVNPLVHYLEHGRQEGRPLAPRLAAQDGS